MSWFDLAAATQELPHVGLDLDGVSWHAAFNRLDEVDTTAHKQCALRLGRLLAAFAPGYVNLAKPRPGDTVDASLARLQAITPPCTGDDNGSDPELVELPCGCQDAYYVDGGVCYEHNHVECDGQPYAFLRRAEQQDHLDHPHPSAGDEAATGLAADPAGGVPASSTPPAAGDTP